MRVETERLLLVPIGPERAEDLYRLHQDPWVATWYAGTWTRDDAAAFASSCARAWMSDGSASGWPTRGQAEVSPVVAGCRSFRKRGMATEVGRAALSFASDELGASRVIAFTERHNLASRRVMEKLGRSLTGEIRTRGLAEGHDEEQNDAPLVVYATQEPGMAAYCAWH